MRISERLHALPLVMDSVVTRNTSLFTIMAIKLKSYSAPSSPFTFDLPPDPSSEPTFLPSPPTSWLSARDMKIFGARPLTSTSEIGLVRCQECGKPLLKSFIAEHSGDFLSFPLPLKPFSRRMFCIFRHMCRCSCWGEEASERKDRPRR
jgi:hypothetical protein